MASFVILSSFKFQQTLLKIKFVNFVNCVCEISMSEIEIRQINRHYRIIIGQTKSDRENNNSKFYIFEMLDN